MLQKDYWFFLLLIGALPIFYFFYFFDGYWDFNLKESEMSEFKP